ncbi:gp50 [Burkholderia phage phi644-2]|uniref:Gp50 n=1 Tax=Burkholderia phage phi644-2 TaxID=2881400 RepID=A4JX45_9CAUD|nr:gp50 [Burkholderia phage phi644-2]ABO60832.1 gp50 [Burkholderia phage phi644-2]
MSELLPPRLDRYKRAALAVGLAAQDSTNGGLGNVEATRYRDFSESTSDSDVAEKR